MTDWAGIDVAEIRRRYATELADLERLAVQCLALPELQDDPTSFIYLLEAVLAFRDEPVWQRHLEGLAEGEYELSCPSCESDLYLAIDDQIPDAGKEGSTDDGATHIPIIPADPHLLDGVGARLHRIAVDHNQPQVARQLTYLFGQTTCPDCETTFPIAEAVAADDALSQKPWTRVGFIRDEDNNFEVLVIGYETTEEWIEIQRALKFDDQDITLGMGTYCLVNSGHAATYGGIKAWHLADGRLRLTFKKKAARTLGFAKTIEFPVDAAGETLIRQHLDRILCHSG